MVKVDPRNPLGQFAAVCIPGIGVFGTASPVAQFKNNTIPSVNKLGTIWLQTATGVPNCGVSLGSSGALKLSVSSGVIECISWGSMPLFRTGASTWKNGDFYVDIDGSNKARLVKANVAVILETTNTVAVNNRARIAWSYNGTTGRARIAYNGILTSGTSAQSFDHSGDAVVCGYDTSSGTGTNPSNVSLFAISPNECFDDAALIRLSLNPWQIFEPEEIPLFKPSGATAYTLIASGGAYAINGALSNLYRSKYLQGSGGSYTLSGSVIDIRRSKRIDAQGGSYVYQGAQATITHGVLSSAYTLACLGGSYVISGATAHVLRNKYLALSSGTYIFSGQSVNLLRSYKVSVLGGVYSITGADTHTLKSKQLVAQGGSYTLSGQQAILNKNRLLTAISGVYLIGGSSIIISKSSVGGYPAEADVRLGIVYGASSEYTGTLDIGKKFRLDIATGNVVMVLDGDKVITL